MFCDTKKLLRHLAQASPSLASMLQEIEILTTALNTKFKIRALGRLAAHPEGIAVGSPNALLDTLVRVGIARVEAPGGDQKQIHYAAIPSQLAHIRASLDRLIASLSSENASPLSCEPVCQPENARYILCSMTRLAILCLLFETDVSAGDLEDWLGVSISTGHIHLDKLEEVELATSARASRNRNAPRWWNPNQQAIFGTLFAVRNLLSDKVAGP